MVFRVILGQSYFLYFSTCTKEDRTIKHVKENNGDAVVDSNET